MYQSKGAMQSGRQSGRQGHHRGVQAGCQLPVVVSGWVVVIMRQQLGLQPGALPSFLLPSGASC